MSQHCIIVSIPFAAVDSGFWSRLDDFQADFSHFVRSFEGFEYDGEGQDQTRRDHWVYAEIGRPTGPISDLARSLASQHKLPQPKVTVSVTVADDPDV